MTTGLVRKRKKIVSVVLLSMKLRLTMKLKMRTNGKMEQLKSVLLVMIWMNWVPLLEKSKEGEEGLVYGSKYY